jgi:hypothetical protein
MSRFDLFTSRRIVIATNSTSIVEMMANPVGAIPTMTNSKAAISNKSNIRVGIVI